MFTFHDISRTYFTK